MHLLSSTPTRRADGEAGSVLIEVIVTATLLIIVALGVFKAMDAADARGAGTKGKAVAGNIAQAEQERLRSLTLDELSNYSKPPLEVTQNGAKYSVASRAEWVTDATGEADCETSGAKADYLKITTTVTSTALRGRAPVKLDSILSPPARAFKQSEGSIAVKITDRHNKGVAGLSLSLSGPENVSGITNDKGCVLWGYLPASDAYTLTYSRAGWVDPDGHTSISKTVGVVGEQTRTFAYSYDEGGSLRANYVTKDPKTGTLKPTSPTLTAVDHATGLKSFSMTGSTITTPLLYPYESDYTIYADGCDAARPTSGARSKLVLPGPVTDAGEIELPALNLLITRNGNPVNNASVHVTTACGTQYDRPTSSDGKLIDPGFPYGTGFKICAHDASRERKLTGVANDTLTGRPLITIELTGTGSTAATCSVL